jgi:hypothetical protein
MKDPAPGRACPVSYRYPPRVFDRAPEIVAETLYVVGGLYGNVEALQAIHELAAAEAGPVAIAFNGDFHWFDVARGDFAAIESGTQEHFRLRGNVETEIAGEDSGAGCGCAYPADVSDAEVSRSNEILAALRETARQFPAGRAALARLPMHFVARVGETKVGIVHGDAASLAGWGFAHDQLDNPAHARWIASAFREAKVDVFASSHTCLPALRRFDFAEGARLVANNGAAGMPNFSATPYGLLTRISLTPALAGTSVLGTRLDALHVDEVAIRFDAARWQERFLASWPEGSPAHASYFGRITQGPRFTADRAVARAA